MTLSAEGDEGESVEVDGFAAAGARCPASITARTLATFARNGTTVVTTMGHTEFSAGTFYRYATIDLRDLARNIGDNPAELRELTSAFLSAFILSLPQAKKNSTAPHTIPDLVHVSVRTDRPLSYAAAFESPVAAAGQGGFSAPSRTTLSDYAAAANRLIGTSGILTSGWAGVDALRCGNAKDQVEQRHREHTGDLGRAMR